MQQTRVGAPVQVLCTQVLNGGAAHVALAAFQGMPAFVVEVLLAIDKGASLFFTVAVPARGENRALQYGEAACW